MSLSGLNSNRTDALPELRPLLNKQDDPHFLR
jgi:hypothetical protein